ncbi:MAG TPA: sigma-70 family RNA polymerase sigma factor [Cyclobacteriaceae bacterium]|nr:sigma-70 family RNA polymerase sigma factor [Cyclobacteriaceae bacterium]HMV10098.1 sigma-70 family RNA polymerase sigma factor [Cyclobacteriaceae bacterium]HMV88651.1 sigma-70 family RNA polymerase sigma factor [Cyclobacteriaceae bacterium]HMX00587.1 sigma-70 family RNA polymerase sigma factor [Cyclobacteriaceae bacterium]HMX49538.1 sigma-70 family RNA polymerase sigma factor [Cyclobacteriaceae bacterium]
MSEPAVNQLVSHLFRHEAGKMAAVLTRMVGLQQLNIAEDIVQDTLLQALNVWKVKGIPENPPAWLYTVAKRKAIDVVRQRTTHAHIEKELAQAFKSEWTLSPAISQLFFDHEIEDSQLRMMFACCHPAIPYESQIALILKTLCGLSISEIAHSFLTTDETITKRLYRAREKIREEGIELEIISPKTITDRQDTVHHTLYLLFSEGYNSTHPDKLIRHDLCEEAMRLCLLLTKNKLTHSSNVNALLALMCYQASRADNRLDEKGNIILLQHQDRTRWNKALIHKGNLYLDQATSGEELSEYHLEAAIAATHARATSFETTDWNKILLLYDLLSQIKSDPIIELNKAIATGYGKSAEEGLAYLKTVKGLESNSIYYAALGDFYSRLKEQKSAKASYEKAISLTKSLSEIDLLKTKIETLEPYL